MKPGFWKIGLAFVCFWHALAGAQSASGGASADIWAAAKAAAQSGPAPIALQVQGRLQGTLALPGGHTYIPQPHAGQVLQALDNPGNDTHLLGLVFPEGDTGWFMTIRFEPAGYVKDDDAKSWDASRLLETYKKGVQATNTERKKAGTAETEVLGWAHNPAYDATTHRLTWAVSSRDKGAAATEPQGVNYNTAVLGRDGYFSTHLVTDLSALPTYQPAANALLESLLFADGRRYSDFNASIDRVSDAGLSALVVGAAAPASGVLEMVFSPLGAAGGLVLLLLGGGAAYQFRKRQAKAAADDFAHTIVVDPDTPERTLPQPLAPHPHADQVWTGQHGPKG